MNLEEVLNYRRSVRNYDPEKELDTEKVKHCIELATLAPNSSNMQLWEFYHIINKDLLFSALQLLTFVICSKSASSKIIFVFLGVPTLRSHVFTRKEE